MTENENTAALVNALQSLMAGYDRLPEFRPRTDPGALEAVLQEVAERMRDNYPYFHPFCPHMTMPHGSL